MVLDIEAFLELVKAKEMAGNGKSVTEEVAPVSRVVAGCSGEIMFDDNCPADVPVTTVDAED